jgi:hypothetical protein
MQINRCPKGKFVTREGMLRAWLPLMLSWMWHKPLIEMLQVACRWCDFQAGEQMQSGSLALFRWVDSNPQGYAECRMAEAQRWFQRKAILAEAMQKLEALQ